MLTKPGLMLRIEGGLLLAVSCWGFHLAQGSWLIFALLFLLPDLSMLGYLVNPGMGSTCYNLVHALLIPVVLAVVGVLTDRMLMIQGCLIWIAHIEFDRMLGYGLKYPSSFKDTHFQRM